MPGHEPTPLLAVASIEDELATLRHRVETYELEDAIRYKDRVTELELEVADLRRQNAVLNAEMQRSLTMTATVLAAYGPQPVSHPS